MDNDKLEDEMQSMLRATYMRREYAALTSLSDELQGMVFAPHTMTPYGDDIYKGIIFIRARRSPWFLGAFPFTVVFPFKYPYECPVASFDRPLRSHPLLQNDHCTIPFEMEYMSIGEATKVSLMLRLLKFIRYLFTQEMLQEHNAKVDLGICRNDVEQCSVSYGMAVNAPYESLLNEEMLQWLMATEERTNQTKPSPTTDKEHAEEGDLPYHAKRPLQFTLGKFAEYFTSTLVPRVNAITASKNVSETPVKK